MRASNRFVSVCAALQLAFAPASARVAVFPPELVGPPRANFTSGCPVQVRTPGGTTPGARIPVPALALGSPVQRNPNSFTTGGSGTAAVAEWARRRKAGLQYDPRTFDPAGSERPSVHAVAGGELRAPWAYQRLPLKAAGQAYSPNALVFAQAVTPTAGRIASLALVLPAKPAARPRLTITGGYRLREGCRTEQAIHVYAPAMSAAHIRRLFDPSGCNWANLAACKTRAELPRGRVLFVQASRSGVGYEYRWVDYDMLTAGIRDL